MKAKTRYDYLTKYRTQFLDTAIQCSNLTLPNLIRQEEETSRSTHARLITPWQSVGAKGVVTLASKLMLALLPPQTSFFKLQIDDSKIGVDLPPEARSDLDLSFAKLERSVMEIIAASSDRVTVHQALKHLVVGGNALIYMGPKGLKLYPLNRYVVDRDGNGEILEIVTRERISRKLLQPMLTNVAPVNSPGEDGADNEEDVDVYTWIRRDNNRFIWHQEVFDKIIPGSQGKAPLDANPWLVLRFNVVDGEPYGRGRVEEFLGDLRSLEALMQALVEGSAVAAKVVFTVSPSSTTKPQTLASAGNGAIVQGRPDDISVVQVGKTADFRTAMEMAQVLERRLSEAFLILNVRNSERTTAEEVRMTQMELEQQLGGLFSLLTVEFLVPYLNRKLSVLQKNQDIPKIPKDLVRPTIVAGINALGRGQDRESLGQFFTIIAQTLGPEAVTGYMNIDEAIKRLAAAQGIDVLNLVKSMQEIEQEREQNFQKQQQMELTKQTAALASTPVMDPSKNPEALNQLYGQANPGSPPETEQEAQPVPD
ncbi:head-to-tail connector (portal) [Synechococcus phage S-CBP1]|uniref:Head-to-tail connector (Portal) n=1 Tax=Synechococcus phage S-CBP1 TaxID=1273711 RepID=A0A096VKF5_9CAUD|nr:head-to-tail connector (portal) [Synechococcus phage S-CBP1]AGK86530.1 head-to-tail connector (portal) [Synechococcus phage S-CBP1]